MSRPELTVWKQAPFTRLIFPLMAGIAAAWYFPFKNLLSPQALIISFLPFLTILLVIRSKKFRYKKYGNVLAFLIVFLLGFLLTLLNDASLSNDFAGKFLNKKSFAALCLKEPLIEKPRSWKAKAEILWISNDSLEHNLQKVSGNALLYFQKTDHMPPLQYGDVVLILNNLQPIQNSGNPGAFDYIRYCHFQNIYFQAYLPKNSWEKLPYKKADPVIAFLLRCRNWCVNVLEKYITQKREAGVAEALLLGYRDNLDKKLVQAYANAGVVHIISISGLHLGLIYLILVWLLRPVSDKGKSGWFKGGIIIVFLWSFSLFTGAAPATLRAAIMFSFMAAGKFFIRRYVHIFNTLAASAFLLLCYDPFLLFDVGFQLSYLAVAGILIFQRPVYNLLISKNKIANYCWEMMSLTLSAQILTFPVVMFYFHQFPLLFMFSNFIVVPLASVALYGEMILLALSFIHPVAWFTGMVLTQVIAFMNEVVVWVNSWSFARWQHISFTFPEVIFLYVFIISIAIWIFYKNKKAFLVALAGFFCFSAIEMVKKLYAYKQRRIIVYNIADHTAIDFIEGNEAYFMGDSTLKKDKASVKYNLYPARVSLKASLVNDLPPYELSENFIRFFKIKLVWLGQPFYKDTLSGFFPVNYAIVSKNNRLKMRQIKRHFSPQEVIFDASVPFWKIEKWKTACKQLNLPCFSVPDQGAWVLEVE